MKAAFCWIPLLFIGIVAISSVQASAGHEVLLDRRPDFGQDIRQFRFRIEASAGRAWVEVDYINYVETGFDQNGGIGDKTLIFEAPGLRFDTVRSEVIYTDDGIRVVCSKVTERHAFPNRHYWVFENTGKCRIQGSRSTGPGNGGPEIPVNYNYDTYLEATERTIP